MKIEVLVSAMHQADHSLYQRMNLSTDAVIINQCDRLEKQEEEVAGCSVLLYSCPDRGVGRSRNLALAQARGDICLFADEDMIYVDGYESVVQNAFLRWPQADAILFGVESLNPERPLRPIIKNGRIRARQATPYGASQIAFRLDRVLKRNIWFSLLFGGGAPYGCGEDSIFLQDLFRAGLRVYTCTDKIADAVQEESSWFAGFTDKYFYDRGALFAAMYGKRAYLYASYAACRLARRSETALLPVWKLVYPGIAEFLS